jgi:hypothetical protein
VNQIKLFLKSHSAFISNSISLLKDYSGFIGFSISLLIAYWLPYFWVNEQEFLFGMSVYLGVFTMFFTVVLTLLSRIKNFYKQTESISKLLVLYFELILVFSSIYMWLYILGETSQISGFDNLTKVTKEGFDFSLYAKELSLIIVDSFHFSIVTGTTLGYGDMLPKHWFSKLVVDFQVLTTIWVVIIGYGNASQKHNKSIKQD